MSPTVIEPFATPVAARHMIRVTVTAMMPAWPTSVSYTHLRAHETVLDLVCRLLLEKKKKTQMAKTAV